MATPRAPRWDIFCRVVDNHGDAGVCWRLARELAGRGLAVRLVIDDAAALAWMAPEGAAGVQVWPWPGPPDPSEVVIEAFGCDPPPAFVQAMKSRQPAPVWINLEYLSAEAYVERSHGLPSPQRNGLTKWFYYPGFSAATGGLLREAGVVGARAAFDRQPWLEARGLALGVGERLVSLFCYANAALPRLLQALAAQPTLLLLTPGPAQQQVQLAPAGVRLARLPWLSQNGFDELLWASDLNFVRGEDSLVRAIWAGAPFVWQAYPQHDGAHLDKLEALLAQWAAPAPVAALWRAWNGTPGTGWPGLDISADWQQAARHWRSGLQSQPDLVTRLLAFAAAKAGQNT